MPPKKFQSLSDFLDEQPKDPNLVPSPYGGYFRKTDGIKSLRQQSRSPGGGAGFNSRAQKLRDWNQGSPYLAHPKYQSYQSNNGAVNRKSTAASASAPVSTPSSSTLTSPSSGASLVSLNNALSELSTEEDNPVKTYLSRIPECKNISECKNEINSLIEELDTQEATSKMIEQWSIRQMLVKYCKTKNHPLIKESAMLLITSLAQHFTSKPPQEAYLLPLLDLALDACSEKDSTVKRAAQHAIDALVASLPMESLTANLLPQILRYLSSSGAKWQSKAAALSLIDRIRENSPPDLLELTFKQTVPVLTDVATDFKPELAKLGYRTLLDYVSILDNLDLSPRYKLIVDTLQDPSRVPESVKALSSVTFVAEVTEPALSLLVPILDRSLKLSSSSQEQLRQTVIVIENLTRLVNNRVEIESFIPVLLPGVERVVNTASLPEVRELASKALKVLKGGSENDSQGGESSNGGQGAVRITFAQGRKFLLENLAKVAKADVFTSSDSTYPLSPFLDDILADGKEGAVMTTYLSRILTVDANVNDWKRLEEYLVTLLGEQHRDIVSKYFIDDGLRAIFHQKPTKQEEDEGVEIVNTDFSLAYGSRMLLNKTNLRLLQGHRYGLCGRNGAGKSTLMRSIANGQLEGFPDKNTLRTCFVEHRLQGEEANLDVVSFIAKDEELASISSEAIAEALESVGFDEERRAQTVGSLSGGWKMKLELARAMLQKADILLLDEPTNHLDVSNVKWLEDYLLEHTNITSLIVSHDSGFLDAVCTDIIHYENKKLVYYRGNLASFVKQKPEAKAYYTLSDSNLQMHFPAPGILTGVKSRSRAVAKMTDVTFTYPGAEKPSLSHVSCSLSLSSRVAILGPNGAGKSTLIKLLTGELVPQEGKVEKHPNLRIGYIAQHALQHVNEHKEKTAIQYLEWRYRFGEDREVLLKESRKISDEERELLKKKIDVGDGRGAREIEAIVGRQKLKRSFQYEIKWKYWKPKYNSWVPRERLVEEGFEKLVQKFDDHEAGREGLGYRELVPSVMTKHFEDVGLDAEIANHTALGSLSGGQLVKVVIAGAMWNNPHLLVLDEPTNYLDRDSLGALAIAIRDWSGGVVMISHNSEFVGALCPEQWIIEGGKMVQKGSSQVDQSRFEDGGNAEAVGIKAEDIKSTSKTVDDDDSPANIKVKQRKKRMTRNEKKAQAERRRLRYLEWLSSPKGTPRPPDTDDEDEE